MKTDLIVSLGERYYSVERPWGEIPESIRLNYVTDVAVDSLNRVYLFQRGDPPVIVFDETGKYLRSWGSGRIADAHAVFCRGEQILLVDRDAHEIQRYDTNGNLEMTLGKRHRPQFQAPFNAPTDVAVAPNGDIYVADGYGNSTVHWFSPEGELKATWGKPGRGPGEFMTPHAVRVHPDGRVLVADRENDRVQVFSADGKFLDEWRDLFRPMDLYIDTEGNALVTDQVPRLSMFSPQGRLLGRCRPSTFNAHGVFGDSKGRIFLAETPPEDRLACLVPIKSSPRLPSSK